MAVAANQNNSAVVFNKNKDAVSQWRENMLAKNYIPKASGHERAHQSTLNDYKQNREFSHCFKRVTPKF